jgi:DMSO/TMAO reductase YedYZ molybdopterin-dependent catalytic subunit
VSEEIDVTTEAVPPGQVLTRRFPVVGERAPAPGAAWRLEVDGLVARPLSLALDQALALPGGTLRMDVHCVTGWTRRAMTFQGAPLAALLERAGPLPAARFVRFVARSERDHDTSLPLEIARGAWLAHGADGAPLSPEHGGPLRLVTPGRYFYKSLKWLRRIELLAEDRLGYWERESAYHNGADPWPGDQRYRTGSLDPARLARLRAAADFSRWRGPRGLVLGADLRGWAPATLALGAVALKACDLRGAQLGGADLTGANLTRSDLRGADLSGADLRGADLEGANLEGADMTGADLSGAALTAAHFVGARVGGLRLAGAWGLLEDQEAWLRAQGVAL